MANKFKVGDRVRLNKLGRDPDNCNYFRSYKAIKETWESVITEIKDESTNSPYAMTESGVAVYLKFLELANDYQLVEMENEITSGTIRYLNSTPIVWNTSADHPANKLIISAEDSGTWSVNFIDNENFGINKPKKTLMKTVSNFMKKFLDPGAQSLVKAGFINGDLELTLEGKEALFSVLFDANKEALVKLAKDKIKEEEEKK